MTGLNEKLVQKLFLKNIKAEQPGPKDPRGHHRMILTQVQEEMRRKT